MNNIVNKGKFGKFIKINEYIQIPHLQYDKSNNLNENSYILLSDIKDKYDLVKGTAGEEDFWNDIKSKFQQEKVNGYQSDSVYETDADISMVEMPKIEATHIFWIPIEEKFSDDELNWIYTNTEEYSLCFNGEYVTEMYAMLRHAFNLKRSSEMEI